MSLKDSATFGINRSQSRYSISVYVAYPNAPCKDGTTSFGGHMWYSVDDNQTGAKSIYGFMPEQHGSWRGAGTVKSDDCETYQKYDTWVIPISEEQAHNLLAFRENAKINRSFGDYNGLNNSCVDFVWNAMYKAGMGTQYKSQIEDGKLLPGQNIPYLWGVLDDQASKMGITLSSGGPDKYYDDIQKFIETHSKEKLSNEQLDNLTKGVMDKVFNTNALPYDHSLDEQVNKFAEQYKKEHLEIGKQAVEKNPETISRTAKGKEIYQTASKHIDGLNKEVSQLSTEKETLKGEPLTKDQALKKAASDYLKGEDKKVNSEYKQIQEGRNKLNEHEKKIMDYGKENGLDKTMWRHAPSIFKGEGLKYYETEKSNIEKIRSNLDKREIDIKSQAQGLKEQLKTPEAQTFLQKHSEQHLASDKERQEKLQAIETKISEKTTEKKEVEDVKKSVPYKVWDKDFTVEGDAKDVSNLLKQADSIQQQSVQYQQSIGQSNSIGRAV